MNYGFLQDAIEATAYLFGQNKVPYIFFNESGDWEKWLPKYESQAEKFESEGCRYWGTQNQIETFHNFLYNTEPNYDEWFNYAFDPGAGDVDKAYKNIRTYGLVPSGTVPEPDTREEAMDQSRITKSMLAKGQYWLKQYELQHEWLWTTPPSNALEVLKDALKTSPIACSVTAWYRNEEGKYYDKMLKNNHWVMIYRIDDEGIHIFDSYNLTKKTLTHDHYIKLAKRIYVNKKTIGGLKTQISILSKLLSIFKKRVFMHPLEKEFPVSQKFLTPNSLYDSGVHNGTDYVCPSGTPVYAPSDGEIIHVFKKHPTMGNAVYFSCDDEKHYIRFLHLSEMASRGKYKQGDEIGKTGNTGMSTGSHLHIDVWNIPFNVSAIKTKEGVQKYLIDPEAFFRKIT